MGVGIMAMGTFIALLPERAFAFAAQTVPGGAATTTLLVLLLDRRPRRDAARAAHRDRADGRRSRRSPRLEKSLQSEIVCMCGTCGRQRISECTCAIAEQMRVELAGLVAKGMTHDQVDRVST